MTVICRKIESIAEFIDAIRLRVDVFIIEQNCPPGWEPDEVDRIARQYIAIHLNEIVSTGRSREAKPGEFKIERIATRADMRRKGVGASLVKYILEDICSESPERIWMQSQVHARSFYEELGFVKTSEEFELDGIPHINMDFKLL